MPIRRFFNVSLRRTAQPPTCRAVLRTRAGEPLPPSVDLRSKCPPIYDQGELGSCTANALAAIFEMNEVQPQRKSRLMIYYNERKLENSIPEDSGAALCDGIDSLKRWGVCLETLWPYDISKFAVCPPPICYNQAYKAINAYSVAQDATSMKTCLAAGYPFVLGIAVYDSFVTDTVAQTGVVPLPQPQTEEFLGGHAIVCVGYDDVTETWLLRNSWGTDWGQAGYFTVPYAYLLDVNWTSDLWDITDVAEPVIVPATTDDIAVVTDSLQKLQRQVQVYMDQINKRLKTLETQMVKMQDLYNNVNKRLKGVEANNKKKK